MLDQYAHTLAQCDIPAERRSTLESYRAKRRLWLSWISTDEHHAIWTVLSDMVWTDASFKALASFATGDESNGLNNHLLAEALFDGHVATQVLAIRRLMDDGNSDIISLRRLVKDLRRNWSLYTRENYVCFDGLPYDLRGGATQGPVGACREGIFLGRNIRPESLRYLAHGA